jgi:glycosyltransferase involved in cell wall biosynthesis
MNNLLVSIAIITYNQVEFVSEAIESVLEQKHTFDFEINISDDGSNDGTVEVLKSYKQKYPSKINLFLNKKNVGTTSNLYELLIKCKGNFIALLEGDDYWTDKNKLEKQVNFLIQNSEYIACSHRYKVVNEKSNEVSSEYFGEGRPNSGDYCINDFENYRYIGLFGSIVFNNFINDNKKSFEIIKSAHHFIADITLNLLLVLNGKVYVMDDIMAAHRIIVRKNGTNFKSTINKKNQIKDRLIYLHELKLFTLDSYNVNLLYTNRLEHNFGWSLLYFIRFPSKHNYVALVFIISQVNNKFDILKYLINCLIKAPKFIYNYLMKNVRSKFMSSL